jgi:hypothetical protein
MRFLELIEIFDRYTQLVSQIKGERSPCQAKCSNSCETFRHEQNQDHTATTERWFIVYAVSDAQVLWSRSMGKYSADGENCRRKLYPP